MSTNANLVPPAVKTKNDAGKAAMAAVKTDAPKVAKAPKAPADPNAPKKERAPRQEYGFAKDAIIRVDTTKDHKLRGQRGDWFARLQKSDGKTVDHFMTNNQGVTNNKGNPEPPRGWLRSFVQDGVCKLEGGTKTAAPAAAAPAPAAK